MAVPGVSGVSGVSVGGRSFSAADYLVFGVMLAVSAAIGVYHAWADRGRSSSEEFLTGGRRLTALPVSLSLTASFMSAITMLSNPAEVYRYGASIVFFGVSYAVMVLVTSEIFIPLFYKLSVASTYEYLELRFSRAVRLLGTVFFVAQTVLYTGIVIYAPALALNQVTGIDLWGAVVSTGVVCTFYCSVGGLKAVVWTDVFQLGVMLAGFLCVIIGSVRLQGGLASIVSDSRDGGRLVFQDFDLNPLRRHTFWTITVGGSFLWISIYGINQSQVQRYLSCRTMSHARYSLYINLLGLWLVLLCSVFSGVCLYSVYQSCDPWTTGRVAAPDQLVPYLVMDILGDYPGLPGLFVAAAYSGSLSTVSSSINALATVTVEDFIKPHTHLSDKSLFWTSKGTSECLVLETPRSAKARSSSSRSAVCRSALRRSVRRHVRCGLGHGRGSAGGSERHGDHRRSSAGPLHSGSPLSLRQLCRGAVGSGVGPGRGPVGGRRRPDVPPAPRDDPAAGAQHQRLQLHLERQLQLDLRRPAHSAGLRRRRRPEQQVRPGRLVLAVLPVLQRAGSRHGGRRGAAGQPAHRRLRV